MFEVSTCFVDHMAVVVISNYYGKGFLRELAILLTAAPHGSWTPTPLYVSANHKVLTKR